MENLYRIAGLGLSPLLLAQGLYVKRTLLRLPEASGQRSGVEGDGPELKLLIAGDSCAAGVGADIQDRAFSGRLAANLGASFRTSWTLVAQSGYRTHELLGRLMRTEPGQFDLAIVSIGGNDARDGVDPKEWIGMMEQLVKLFDDRFHTRDILLMQVPPIHLFPSLPQPLRWYIGHRAQRFNVALQQFLGSHPQCGLLRTDVLLDVSAMAADLFHPGPRIYEAWGQHAAQVIQQRVRPS